jgi:hypothetical protein
MSDPLGNCHKVNSAHNAHADEVMSQIVKVKAPQFLWQQVCLTLHTGLIALRANRVCCLYLNVPAYPADVPGDFSGDSHSTLKTF